MDLSENSMNKNDKNVLMMYLKNTLTACISFHVDIVRLKYEPDGCGAFLFMNMEGMSWM